MEGDLKASYRNATVNLVTLHHIMDTLLTAEEFPGKAFLCSKKLLLGIASLEWLCSRVGNIYKNLACSDNLARRSCLFLFTTPFPPEVPSPSPI